MVRRRNMPAKMKLEEEKNSRKCLVFSSSSDDEEANEDLSLEIVEKARKLEAKRKTVQLDMASDEAEFNVDGLGAAVLNSEKKKRKRSTRSKKRKNKEKVTEEEKTSVIDVNADENLAAVVDAPAIDVVEMFDNKMKAEESLVTLEDVDVETIGVCDNVVSVDMPLEVVKSAIIEEVGTPNNVVLRKLLRGPRYFDPPDNDLDTCYNCGKEGHIIANCTEEKRKKPCFVCGQFGHVGKHCTQGRYCHICRRRGHIAEKCHNKDQSSQSSKICLRCGDLGHEMSSCENDYAPEDLKEISCYICKSFGHLCCANIVDDGPREVSCFNCGRLGHTSQGCAKVRWEKSTVASPTICYKCGEGGHIARGCTKFAKSDRYFGETSTPRRFSKAHKNLGIRSAPHDVGKVHRKKTTPPHGKKFMTAEKSKHRGGWLTDDPGDMPNGKVKANSWMSPTTPGRNGQAVIWRCSSSRSPFKKHNVHSGTPSQHTSPKQRRRHKFSASRFNNSKGGGCYDWH